jgi:hypothetical protein
VTLRLRTNNPLRPDILIHSAPQRGTPYFYTLLDIRLEGNPLRPDNGLSTDYPVEIRLYKPKYKYIRLV